MEPTPKSGAAEEDVAAPDDDEVPSDVPNEEEAPPKLKVGVADLKPAAAEDSPERAAALDAALVAAPKAKPAPLAGAAAASVVAALAPKEKSFGGETSDAPKVNPAPAAAAAVPEPKTAVPEPKALLAVAAVELEDAVLVKPNDKAAAPPPGAAALELAAVPVLLDVALAPPNEKFAPAICVKHRQNIAAPTSTPGQQTRLVGGRLRKRVNQNSYAVM